MLDTSSRPVFAAPPGDRVGPSRNRHSDAAPAFIEITLTSAGDGTNVEIQFSGLSEEDDAFYGQLWERYLDRIAAAKGSRFPPPDLLRRGVLVLARMRG
jgi:hypothetical protein